MSEKNDYAQFKCIRQTGNLPFILPVESSKMILNVVNF